jgi:hypothetical protein
MRIQLRTILPLLVPACATPAVAAAQIGFPGGITESPRLLVDETGPGEPDEQPMVGFAAEQPAQRPNLTWMAGTGGRAGDAASVFSAFGGFALEAPVAVEGALAYARNIPDGLDGLNVVQGSLELGLLSARLKPLGLALAVSGEAQWLEEIGRGYAVGGAVSKRLGERFEIGGRLMYSGSDPEAGASTWAFVPGLTAAVIPVRSTSMRASYTFDNDVDGEQSYELVGAYRTRLANSPPFQLRAGINQDSDVSLGIVVFFP